MLFTLGDIEFHEVVPRWFDLRETLEPTCNMILGLKYLPHGYLETKLLTAVGAAEVMEGALANKLNRPLPVARDRYKKLRKEILCMAPPEYRAWLDKKLYNTPSLYDKLKLLAAQPNQQVIKALLPDIEGWARRTSDARNDLAHRGESTRVPGAEMAAVVSVTVAVVLINLLDQMGVPPARLLQALEHHPELSLDPWIDSVEVLEG